MENDYPYEIDSDAYMRFHEKNTIFKRCGWDDSLPTFGCGMNDAREEHIESGKEGYSRIDFALVHGGWSVCRNLKNAYSWDDMPEHSENTLKEDGWGIVTARIKKAAKLYGAALVGIAPVREDWIYQTRRIHKENRDEPLILPEGITCAIVMGVEMDASALATAPAQPAAAAACRSLSGNWSRHR